MVAVITPLVTVAVAVAVVPTPTLCGSSICNGFWNLMLIVDPVYPLPPSAIVREVTVPPVPIVAVIFAGDGFSLPSTIIPLRSLYGCDPRL